ncbi:MAG TPA: stage V sporulation protein AE [Clostridia bacterium]|jgi:stage V sporulation protein AE|nr:stage V sporulation protein AE [Clostridia bacterium]
MRQYIYAFVVGGIICVIAQVLMDTTKLKPAHILVLFVTLGGVLSALGVYQPLVNIAGAGATIPIPGFGHAMVSGVLEEIEKSGIVGVFSGGLKATAIGLSAAVLFGYIMALLFNPKG